jgi:hypothetical protein
MKAIAEMLKPRESVFSDSTREDVLNLSDFADRRIDADKFFSENFKTQGMSMLFDTAFKRFKGESDTGVVKLTQAMGGGKTHSMLALALLADNPKLRERILGKAYADIGTIKVVTFSGRENADFGIWGSIAEQLGKKELFSGYYSPLKAPGESAWINLLKEDKILILLDELPPYLENARSITVGNSDLSRVTIAALANLFSALGKEQLSNVCLVFSDLKATYESGSELLQSSFKELDAEANRIAIEIAPVALNSDEVYSILSKRLFEDKKIDPDYSIDKNEIAIAYKDAVTTAKKLGFTSYAGETVYRGIIDSYPFHPSIKDLYARFKENQNFQQTRGLIKLMRQIVRQFWESGQAEHAYLINVFDVNLNTPNLMAMFRQIKPSLEEAISHDIAQEGQAIAEIIDRERADEKDYAQRMAKLLLVSSLSTANHAVLGLTDAEALGYVSAPGIDINYMKACIEELKTQCWYIKTDNRGRLYFQNTKNMVAEMNTLVDSYTNENARKELKRILTENFAPKLKVCYQQLYVLPAVDEIDLSSRDVTLVIFEPYPGNKLHPDLQSFYDNASLKNRVMFLSGERSVMEKLYVNSKKLKAIQTIMDGIKSEGIPATDQQYKEADAQLDKALQSLFSTIRETFVTLYYPTKNGIVSSEFKLEFKENKFNGEDQIISLLKAGMKYDDFSKDDGFLETLRKKCEARLFTTKEMPYSQICDRAATETSWQWYHPDQLDSLKADCLKKDKWREIGGYLVKGPFEKEPTSVTVNQTNYDDKEQEYTLFVKGVGGRVYYDIGADPTAASAEITDSVFKTKEPALRFICIDPSGERKTGQVFEFIGKAPIRYGQRATDNGIVLTLETNKNYEVRYTTDGSEPKENGGIYNGEIVLPKGCKFVRTVALYDGQVIEQKDISVDVKSAAGQKKINETAPLAYRMNAKKQLGDTESSYRELETLSKIDGVFIKGGGAYIFEKSKDDNYVEYNASIPYAPGDLQALIDLVRDTSFKDRDVVVTFEYKELLFTSGAQFLKWVELCKLDMNRLREGGEIVQ